VFYHRAPSGTGPLDAVAAPLIGEDGMVRHRSRAIAGIVALCFAGFGCASPVGVREANPRQIHRYLTRSALTDDQPSDFTQNALRRYEMLEAWKKQPVTTLANLHAAARAEDFPPGSLFALAELAFLHAERTHTQGNYAAAMIYCWALLFPEEQRATLEPLDPRLRVAADLYNRALTSAFKRKGTSRHIELDTKGVAEGTVRLGIPFGEISIAIDPHVLELDGMEFHDLQPVTELEVRGIHNRYRNPGVGAPLGAHAKPMPGVTPVVELSEDSLVPLTAIVLIEKPLAGLRSGKLSARLLALESLDVRWVEHEGYRIPLESEPSAALAASLAESQFWKAELQNFLGNAIGLRRKNALHGVRPYKPGRIPVVFVHGTASSEARWADMINDLMADARLSERFAYWTFSYDSGNPIAYSGSQLRYSLTKAVERADPTGQDPCIQDMVVLGHSQGGLLTKLTAIDSGNFFWAQISDQDFEKIDLGEKQRKLLRSGLFLKPLPFVTEVMFLATPHRGSYLAGPQIVRRLAERMVRLPSDLVRLSADLVTVLPQAGVGVTASRIPTSIDNMSPSNPYIKTLSKIPVDPRIRAHSIVAVADDKPLEKAGDGVVKYKSAHIEGVASELIVRSPHSGMQASPATIEEVRRILLEHSAASRCPVPEG